jgi:glycosyltransferase involved in cell wall biosynthesis
MASSDLTFTALTTPSPLVSVLIPLYNHARYVEQCLDSVKAQDYDNVEVIIVDDGSSDDSYERVSAWRDRNQTALRAFTALRQQNHGINYTLNRLISLSQGQYLVIIASDDYLLPGSIRTRVEAMCSHPEWLLLLGDVSAVNDAGKLLYRSLIKERFHASTFALSHPRLRTTELILHWCIAGPMFTIDRHAYDLYGQYDDTRLAGEDRDFVLAMLSRDKVGFINRVVGAYRIHEGSTARGNRQGVVRLNVLQSEFSYTNKFDGFERVALWVTSRRNLMRYRVLHAPRAGVSRASDWLMLQALWAFSLWLFVAHAARAFALRTRWMLRLRRPTSHARPKADSRSPG